MAETQNEQLFLDIGGDDAEQGTTEIESCCMNCFESVSKHIHFVEENN